MFLTECPRDAMQGWGEMIPTQTKIDYINRIFNKLEQFNQLNPNATPDQCYSKLMEIINQAKQAIINNPNSHLNDLVF